MSQCLDCVTQYHSLLESSQSDAGFDDEYEFEAVVKYLKSKARLRLRDSLSLGIEKFRTDRSVPSETTNAFTEVLNYVRILEFMDIWNLVDSFLSLILSDANVSFSKKDKCQGILLLGASSSKKVRDWARDTMTKLGSFTSPEEIQSVVDPAIEVIIKTINEYRVTSEQKRAESLEGLITVEAKHLYDCLWHILDLVTDDMIACYATWTSLWNNYISLVHVVFEKVDGQSNADVRSLKCLSRLLKASTSEIWEVSKWTFGQTIEMLFAKACGTYEEMSKEAMKYILESLMYLCSSAPEKQREQMMDKTIQFLVCEFPDIEQNKPFALDAEKAACSIIYSGVRDKIYPLKTEPIWAHPMVRLALTNERTAKILTVLLTEYNEDKEPKFRTLWQVLLSSPSEYPDTLHICIWRGMASFAHVQESLTLAPIRALFSAYLEKQMLMDKDKLLWLDHVVSVTFPLMICVSNTVTPAMTKFFNTKIAMKGTLVRKVLDGVIDHWKVGKVARPMLALSLRAIATYMAAAVKIRLSLISFCDHVAEFLSWLDASVPLSKKTGRSLGEMIKLLSTHCTKKGLAYLASVLQLVRITPDLKPQEYKSYEACIPEVIRKEAKPRVLPSSILAAKKKLSPTKASAAVRDSLVKPLSKPLFGSSKTGPQLTEAEKLMRQRALDSKNTAKAAAAAAASTKTSPTKTTRKSVLPLNKNFSSFSTTPKLNPLVKAMQEERKKRGERLLPSRQSLHQHVLEWSPSDVAEGKSDPFLENLRSVPNTFKNTEEYAEVFEPLLLAEIRAAIERDMEDLTEVKHALTMTDIQRRDPFQVLTFQFKKEERDPRSRRVVRDAWSVDDLLEMSPLDSNTNEPLFCIVQQMDWNAADKVEQITVIMCPGSKSINWVPRWEFRHISSVLITAGREYRSMVSLSHIPMKSYIIGGGVTNALPTRHVEVPLLNKKFNPPQVSAITKCMDATGGFVLIQGPPGTGKTRTVLGIIGAMTMYKRSELSVANKRKRILVCASSNRAIDEVTMRLRHGVWDPYHDRTEELKIVRIGREGAVSEGVKPILLERLAQKKCASRTEASELMMKQNNAQVKQIEATIAKYDEQINALNEEQASLANEKMKGNASGGDEGKKKEDNPRDKATEISAKLRELYDSKRQARQLLNKAKEKKDKAVRDKHFDLVNARKEVLRTADIVCATLSATGSDALIEVDLEFDAVIVDEATQATELQTLIPLKYRSKLCILVGDPKQLPATVLSRAAAEKSFHQSLFQRMQDNGSPVCLLSVQYRMHPTIAKVIIIAKQ